MLTLISCAKTMASGLVPVVSRATQPVFEHQAVCAALELSQCPVETLACMLKVTPKIAADVKLCYQDFCTPEAPSSPALYAYAGTVFRHIAPVDFTDGELEFAQRGLRITSFLYGLLRPLDVIRRYRLEGGVRLAVHEGKSMFDFWKTFLTELLVEETRKQGGILLNLASAEMKNLFDWSRVERSVRVVTPCFRQWREGKFRTVTVYAKMCRGEMVRYIVRHRIDHPEALQSFSWEGFRWDEGHSTPDCMMFAPA